MGGEACAHRSEGSDRAVPSPAVPKRKETCRSGGCVCNLQRLSPRGCPGREREQMRPKLSARRLASERGPARIGTRSMAAPEVGAAEAPGSCSAPARYALLAPGGTRPSTSRRGDPWGWKDPGTETRTAAPLYRLSPRFVFLPLAQPQLLCAG